MQPRQRHPLGHVLYSLAELDGVLRDAPRVVRLACQLPHQPLQVRVGLRPEPLLGAGRVPLPGPALEHQAPVQRGHRPAAHQQMLLRPWPRRRAFSREGRWRRRRRGPHRPAGAGCRLRGGGAGSGRPACARRSERQRTPVHEQRRQRGRPDFVVVGVRQRLLKQDTHIHLQYRVGERTWRVLIGRVDGVEDLQRGGRRQLSGVALAQPQSQACLEVQLRALARVKTRAILLAPGARLRKQGDSILH
mmetsp:Transcript_8250/g.15623  ORF Transcript_8250/g.15623 Transcript_8250/m.15623 type:complete len:247 (+) Transcript_8250:875-1615(+)